MFLMIMLEVLRAYISMFWYEVASLPNTCFRYLRLQLNIFILRKPLL